MTKKKTTKKPVRRKKAPQKKRVAKALGRKKVGTKKTQKPAQGAKAAFVRRLPRSMPAREVQAKGAAVGLHMSIAYIHNIRSAAGKKSREVLKKDRNAPKGNKRQKEKLFRSLVIDLGPARAKTLLESVETALAVRSAS